MDISFQYVAGLFDGEGSVGLYPSKSGNSRSVKLLVQFTQLWHSKSELVWRQMHENWGGSLGTFVNLSGKPTVNWQLNGAEAIVFLSDIRPWTVLKADQIDAATDWWAGRTPPARDSGGRMLPRSDESWDEALRVSETIRQMKFPEASALIDKGLTRAQKPDSL